MSTRYTVLDIETCPVAEDKLLAMMPEDLRDPAEPQEVTVFTPPDMSKCPAYSGDTAKQQIWRDKTLREAEDKFARGKSDWLLKCAEARQKWMSDAALHAPRGSVKIIGLRNVTEGVTACLLVDCTQDEKAKIEAVKEWPCKVAFSFLDEVGALNTFRDFVEDKIGYTEGGILVGFWIRHFDFRFLLRRSMIVGAKFCHKLIRNFQYFDDSLFIDLSDSYLLGERELKIGGLAGLSKILGVTVKEGSGENFGSLWKSDPVAAILYHLNENLVIEACAKKMGAIQ